MPQSFASLISAAIDGRCSNFYHRQTQLERLFKAFQEQADAIHNAIISDQGYSTTEAAVEYTATARCIREAYQSLDPTQSLKEEYAIAKGKNAADNRRPVGIVYVEPLRHTFFYSTISPLVSTIAAGNCVVVLLERNLTASNSLLRQLLMDSLEQDTFSVAEQPVTTQLPRESTIYVLQDSDERCPRSNQAVSLSSAPVVAMVDRTGDLESAARELVKACFSFGGRSPYAPDLVAVNEFVQQDFLRAVTQACVGCGGSPHEKTKRSAKPVSNVQDTLDRLRKASDHFRVVVQDEHFAVVEANSEQALFAHRLRAPVLVVQSIRSIDDGIQLFERRVAGSCTAAYYFSNPGTGKYLCQFVPSEASFVNHIPSQLLLGPPTPTGHPIDPSQRYSIDLFTVPAAQYIVTTSESAKLTAALQNKDNVALSQLAEEARKPLEVAKRSGGGGIGFFEQGLLLHVGLILTGVLTTSVAAVIYVRRLLR